jgi:hypothetical protein
MPFLVRLTRTAVTHDGAVSRIHAIPRDRGESAQDDEQSHHADEDDKDTDAYGRGRLSR